MTWPNAEGGPLQPADQEKLAEHERRIAEWEDEIARRLLAETPRSHLAQTLKAYDAGTLHRPIDQ